jgi:hypothetical protein
LRRGATLQDRPCLCLRRPARSQTTQNHCSDRSAVSAPVSEPF